MKKILLPICALLLCMTACKKDDEGLIKLKIEHYKTDAKVHIDNTYYAYWDNGDYIWLNGESKRVQVYSDGTASIKTPASADSYLAIYPYDWVSTDDEDIYVTYPPTQTYRTNSEGKQIIDAPMAAQSNGDLSELSFHGLGNILAVEVKVPDSYSESVLVNKIVVSTFNNKGLSPTPIWGTCTLHDGGIEAPTGMPSGNTVTLDCSQSRVYISSGVSKIFYIALPNLSLFDRLSIKVCCDNSFYERKQREDVYADYDRGRFNKVTFKIDDDHFCPIPEEHVFWYTRTDGAITIPSEYETMFAQGSRGGYYYLRVMDENHTIEGLSLLCGQNDITSIVLPNNPLISFSSTISFESNTSLKDVYVYSMNSYNLTALSTPIFNHASTWDNGGTLHLPQDCETEQIDMWRLWSGWGGNIVCDLETPSH